MLDRLFSLYKSKSKKDTPPDESSQDSLGPMDELSGACEDTFMRILIEVGKNGDFSLGFDAEKMSPDEISLAATSIYMLNNGMLDNFFIEALQLWAEDDEVKQQLAKKIAIKWDSIDKLVASEHSNENYESPAIEPFDVFRYT